MSSLKYTREDFMRLIDILEKKFDLKRQTLQKNTIEFRVEDSEPVMTFQYNEDSKKVIMAFHFGVQITDAIRIFEFTKKICPSIDLGKTYYIDFKGKIHIGDEATTKALRDMKDLILGNVENESDKEVLH